MARGRSGGRRGGGRGNWNESLHPRIGGKFAKKAGSDVPSGSRAGMRRRAAARAATKMHAKVASTRAHQITSATQKMDYKHREAYNVHGAGAVAHERARDANKRAGYKNRAGAHDDAMSAHRGAGQASGRMKLTHDGERNEAIRRSGDAVAKTRNERVREIARRQLSDKGRVKAGMPTRGESTISADFQGPRPALGQKTRDAMDLESSWSKADPQVRAKMQKEYDAGRASGSSHEAAKRRAELSGTTASKGTPIPHRGESIPDTSDRKILPGGRGYGEPGSQKNIERRGESIPDTSDRKILPGGRGYGEPGSQKTVSIKDARSIGREARDFSKTPTDKIGSHEEHNRTAAKMHRDAADAYRAAGQPKTAARHETIARRHEKAIGTRSLKK